MIIFKEKRAQSKLSESYQVSSKEEMFAAIEKYKNLQFSLFLVGPDKNFIESARLIPSPAGTHLFKDKNGNIGGFADAAVSNRVDKWGDEIFNFNVGRIEYKLFINVRN